MSSEVEKSVAVISVLKRSAIPSDLTVTDVPTALETKKSNHISDK
jgi:hypothetical protein